MKNKFFKAFKIKQRWWDYLYDFDNLSIGHYNTKKDLFNSLRECNSWTVEETNGEIERCYKAYPRITNEVYVELVVIANKYNLILENKANTKEELLDYILSQLIEKKELVFNEIQEIFPMPNNESEYDCIECEDGGQHLN